MNEMIHFEELWETAEQLKRDETEARTTSSFLMELQAKLSVYSAIDSNEHGTEAEKRRAKEHLFGKLLMTLTQLSMKDGVNTFLALKNAIEEERIGQLELKYRTG